LQQKAKPARKDKQADEPDIRPEIKELVHALARRAAEKDYRAFLKDWEAANDN